MPVDSTALLKGLKPVVKALDADLLARARDPGQRGGGLEDGRVPPSASCTAPQPDPSLAARASPPGCRPCPRCHAGRTLVPWICPCRLQAGVDIFGRDPKTEAWCGIQCKQRGQWPKKVLKSREIETEITQAESFRPPLSHFIVATTATLAEAGGEPWVPGGLAVLASELPRGVDRGADGGDPRRSSAGPRTPRGWGVCGSGSEDAACRCFCDRPGGSAATTSAAGPSPMRCWRAGWPADTPACRIRAWRSS